MKRSGIFRGLWQSEAIFLLFYKFLEASEIYLFSRLCKIEKREFLYLRRMRYAAVLDNRDFEIPIISVLYEAPNTKIGKYTTNDNFFDTGKFLIQ